MNAKELLIKALKEIGADGLYTNDCDEPCGCGLENFAPCGCDFWNCAPAKKDKNGMYWPMEGKE